MAEPNSAEARAVTIVSVADAPWPDVERVFGTRGDPSTCWCQYFKLSTADWKDFDAAACKAALEEQVRTSSPPPGVIAYRGEEAVGWCAVEPRPRYGRLSRMRVVGEVSTEPLDDESVWAVTCFVVRVGHRRSGIAGALLQGAVEQARSLGARVLEGYPVDVSGHKKTSAADLYQGTVSLFRSAGFDEVGRSQSGRPLMRLQVHP